MISIITPTYNRAELLPRMIQSVIHQSFLDWELLIMDDGSTDSTADVVAAYRDERIKYRYSQNSGAADKRNCGVKEARGENIIFLDSDDEVLPDWLEKMTTALRIDPGNPVTCGWEKINAKGDLSSRKLPQDLGPFFNHYTLNFLSGCLLYRKTDFLEAGGYDPELPSGQHTDLLIRLLTVWGRKKLQPVVVPEILVRIHLHSGSRIRHDHYGLYRGTMGILEKHAGHFRHHPGELQDYLSVAGVSAFRIGRTGEGRRLLWKAAWARPLSARSLLRVIFASIPLLGNWYWKTPHP